MFYSLLFLSILLYVRYAKLDDYQGVRYTLRLIPIVVVMILTFSLQYNVGTDYVSYTLIATKDDFGLYRLNQFLDDKEYIFSSLIYISQYSGVPQLIFFLSALLQVIPFGIALYQLRKESISTFDMLFMYFALSLSFFNQFNGIRQYIAVNLIFLSVLLILRNSRQIWPWILLLITPLVHHAAWIMIVAIIAVLLLYQLFQKQVTSKKVFFIIAAFCLIFYFLDVNSAIRKMIATFDVFDGFRGYIKSSYLEKMSLMEIATKVAKLVVVFYAVFRLDIDKLTKFEKKLLTLSYVAVFVMILAFSSTAIWRIYLFFDLFLIMPVVLFYKYTANKKEKVLINIYLLAFLAVKILLFPRGEYLYASILGR